MSYEGTTESAEVGNKLEVGLVDSLFLANCGRGG